MAMLATAILTFVPLGKTDPKLFGPLTLTITKTQTEEQVVKEAGFVRK